MAQVDPPTFRRPTEIPHERHRACCHKRDAVSGSSRLAQLREDGFEHRDKLLNLRKHRVYSRTLGLSGPETGRGPFAQWECSMKTAGYRVALLLAAVLACGSALLTACAARAQQQAITATVTGEKIQKVGFRAMIQKEAIMYNLAGFAPNNPDGTVEVRLQGDKDRIDQILDAIRVGSKKSSHNNTISQVPAEWDPNLKTFTVFAWTSTSRNIMNPYDLVFSLRSADDQISHKDAKAIWNDIAKSTLKGDDLAKFLKHLGDDDD